MRIRPTNQHCLCDHTRCRAGGVVGIVHVAGRTRVAGVAVGGVRRRHPVVDHHTGYVVKVNPALLGRLRIEFECRNRRGDLNLRGIKIQTSLGFGAAKGGDLSQV